MTVSGWKIAALMILAAAVAYRIFATGGEPRPAPSPKPAERAGAHDEPLRFLKRIHGANARMHAASGHFSDAITVAIEKPEEDADDLQRTHAATLDVIQTVRDEFTKVTPPDSPEAAALMEEYKQYLAWQEQVYREDFMSLIRGLQQTGLGDLERRNLAMSIMHKRAGEELAKNDRLNELREAFCVRHDLPP